MHKVNAIPFFSFIMLKNTIKIGATGHKNDI